MPGSRFLGCSVLVLALAACATAPGPAVVGDAAASSAFRGWQHLSLPGKTATAYRPVRYGSRERDTLEVRAQSSASVLRRKLDLAPQDLGASWWSNRAAPD